MPGKSQKSKVKSKELQTSNSSKGSKGAQTMDELLARTGYELHGLQTGQRIEGTVVDISAKTLILNIGAKAEGLVTGYEFEDASSFIKTLAIGDKVEVAVVAPESELGQPLLSVREAGEDYAWSELQKSFKGDLPVEVRLDAVVRGGLAVTVYGLSGFIPSSQQGVALTKDSQAQVGKFIMAKAIEIDRGKNRVVLSEKEVSEAGLLLEQKEALKKVKVGEKFPGRVSGIANFGVFVEVDKDGTTLNGLVHLSELSWQKVSDPNEVISEGDKVEVLVIGKEGTRLALSVKRLQEDPWEGIVAKYGVDQSIKGKVTRLGDFGAFIEIESGVEGIVRLGKIPPGISLKEGQEVSCFIEEIDKKTRRITLSLILKQKPVIYK
ncbi:MAG: S1 RNA-binding domain-containing protein [bacterium]|nr:S1 RNA-binding domain-containing protein [bacterium]